jgi:glycerophosphoryl diester phosphodiesterase
MHEVVVAITLYVCAEVDTGARRGAEEGMTRDDAGASGMVRVGHRGAAGHAPENTLSAIRKGIALGADFIEVDVQRSRDGRLVVMHDRLVDRTTNGSGLVEEMSWKELQRLDAGGGERVPDLQAALAEIEGRAGAMLEVKAAGIGTEVWRAVRSARFRGPVVYASFFHAEVLAIRELDAAAQTMALLEGVPVSGADFALAARATLVGLAHDFATAEFVSELHAARLGVWMYTLNEPRLIARAIGLGADGVISDYPELVPRIRP